jgi:hypothetical protein
MAIVSNGNTLFVDATGTVTTKSTIVYYITVTATAANGVLVLSDNTTNAKKADLRVATSGATQTFDFSAAPLHFPTGVKVTTATTVAVTLVV